MGSKLINKMYYFLKYLYYTQHWAEEKKEMSKEQNGKKMNAVI